MQNGRKIIIGLIARRDAAFFRDLLPQLRQELPHLDLTFLTFHAGCETMLQHCGFSVYNFHRWKRTFSPQLSAPQIETRYGMPVENIIVHEALTHHHHDHTKLVRKTALYLQALEALFEKIQPDLFITELGGFIAHLTVFLVCRRRGVTHYTIEPAFFPKRCFWVKDSLYARLPADIGPQLEETEQAYIRSHVAEIVDKKLINIPDKDQNHFKDMNLRKLFTLRNGNRLISKLTDKYIRGCEEEFDAVFQVVRYNFWKLKNRKINAKYYSQLADLPGKFVYYPLHVPLDVQLTVRSKSYLNQHELIRRVIANLPDELVLATKEHPASIGAYDFRPLDDLIKNRRLMLLHPTVSSHDLVDRALYVLTVNSKVGIEALFRHRKTVTLGDSIYRGEGITTDLESVEDLKQLHQRGLRKEFSDEALDTFLRRSYNWSLPGELYEHSPENLHRFSSSLSQVISGAAR